MLRKLGQSFQIALPKEIVKVLGLRVNDYLDINVENDRIVLEPKAVIPKEQAYFFTPEWQKGEKEADQDIRKKRVTKSNA